MKTKYKYILVLSACIVCAVSGFFAGRSVSNVITDTKYIKGETIHRSIPKIELVPYAVTTPVLLSYRDPVRKDSTGKAIITATPANIDSAMVATVKDWNLKRSYSKILFDNQYGKEDYKAVVQYNELQELSYNFTPITKETTIEKLRTFTPFISASYSTFNIAGVGGGFYYHNVGFELQYLRNYSPTRTQDTGFMGSVKYKF